MKTKRGQKIFNTNFSFLSYLHFNVISYPKILDEVRIKKQKNLS